MIVGASVALVAIIGGLLVAKFVGLDADQRTASKILADARGRLQLARGRVQTARNEILRWDAGDFFGTKEVIDAVLDRGVESSTVLVKLANWPHEPDELAQFVPEIVEEASRASEAIKSRISDDDLFWSDFRRQPDLPDARWPAVWRHVFDTVKKERAEEGQRRRKAEEEARRNAPPKSAIERQVDSMNEMLQHLQHPAMAVPLPPANPPTDHAATEARRSDELMAVHTRAQQQVEDYEAELRRLEEDHTEIVKPDARLWWGVGILVVFTICGIVVPVWIMSDGPRNLAPVHWVRYPFLASLAALIVYIVVYLAQLTRRTPVKSD